MDVIVRNNLVAVSTRFAALALVSVLPTLATLAMLTALTTLSGCGANQELVRSVQELRLQSIELNGTIENLNIQLEELENKTLLMNDRLERVEMGAGRTANMPDLPIVRLDGHRGGSKDWSPEPARNSEPDWDPRAGGSSAPSRWDRSSGTVGSWSPEQDGTLESPGTPDREMPAKTRKPSPTKPQELAKTTKTAPLARKSAPKRVTLPKNTHGDDPMRLYKAGYKAVMAGALEEGRQTLFTFLLKHAEHDLADNALYWIGESYYSEKNYADAIQYFQRIVDDYPSGNKVPDAMVKAALTLHRVGEGTQGRFLLTQVVKVYPGTHSADVARKKLAEWDALGGGL